MDGWDKKQLRACMRLYAVTDKAWLGGRTLPQCVQAAIEGGATFVQLRDKEARTEELVVQAQELIPLCRAKGVPFVIDDDIEAARISSADGVHVGQSDVSCAQAREVLGFGAIVGVSVRTPAEAVAAQKAGADYLGVGAIFGTPTKPDAKPVSIDTLRAIGASAEIPVVAIGGLNAQTLPLLAHTGIDGAAVVSALFAEEDITAAARELSCIIDGIIEYA